MSYTSFFATRSDMINWLASAENEVELKYISSGHHSSPELEVFLTVSELPGLGVSSTGNHQDDGWYVFLRDAPVLSSEIHQEKYKRSVWRVGDPMAAVCLFPGGMYGEDCLVHGHFGTISGCDDDAAALKKTLRKHLQKVFTKNGSYYFGPEADALDERIRLIQLQTNEPESYDYKKQKR